MIEASDRIAVFRGRDHARVGAYAIEGFGETLAVGITAGARPRRTVTHDPNEDAGAVVRGRRARLLAVADSHFGREASEAALAHVLAALGDDPPPANLDEDEIIALFHGAGMAVERATTQAKARSPRSRTTLAWALVTELEVQWAAIGDSSVIIGTSRTAQRVDMPRRMFLGSPLTTSTDLAAALSHGKEAIPEGGCVVLASDGLASALDGNADVASVVSKGMRGTRAARDIAQRLLEGALARGVDDAVVLAIAVC